MDIKQAPIFQIESPLIRNVYEVSENYEIILRDGPDVQRDLCAIYFSSHDLYFPNTEKAFQKSIITGNRYEWKNNLIPFACKHIFVRDIQKQWYLEGINAQINSIDKLAQLLLKQTQNFSVFTIGSSAGGFAAIIFGSLLKAKRVYAFSPQLDLNVILKHSQPKVDPLVFKYVHDTRVSSFFKVDNFLNLETKYFYFFSAKSKIDQLQYNALERKDLFCTLRFNSANHGIPFYRHNLNYMLTLKPDELVQLSKHEISPLAFSINAVGVFKTLMLMAKIIFARFRKKIAEKMNA